MIKRVVLGVTGGIAAYKAAEITSRLKKVGCEVRCIMTENAQEIITPLTLETLSGQRVTKDLFEENKEWSVSHIGLAQWADLFLIAPATANIIGKVCHGIADDFLSTTIMATTAPVVFAPAMNEQMYLNPIFQGNMANLKALGYYFIEPIHGHLACGDNGVGKMEDPEKIVDYVLSFGRQDLLGVGILVTAGPTREAIDPVRFLTNHSSGKMGYALAEMAQRRGAKVTLVSGPTALPVPQGVSFVPVVSARDMDQAVRDAYFEQDVVIKAAAVADYRPKEASEEKIKKKAGDWQLVLERNPDILAYLGEHKGERVLVGFAAETNDLASNALGKMQRKNLDLIVANDLTESGAGFGVDTNRVMIFSSDGEVEQLPILAKTEVADRILDRVHGCLLKKGRLC